MAITTWPRTADSPTPVSPSPFAHVAGPLALAAGTLLTMTQLVNFTLAVRTDRTAPRWLAGALTNPVVIVNNVAQFLAFCLLAIALVAAYGRQAERAGTLGAIGVGVALGGTMCIAGDAWFEAFVVTWLATSMPEALAITPSGLLPLGASISFALFALGWALFGIASLRARVFPRAIGLALVVGGLAGGGALAVPPLGAILGLAVAWLGMWLLRAAPAAGEPAAPTTVDATAGKFAHAAEAGHTLPVAPGGAA